MERHSSFKVLLAGLAAVVAAAATVQAPVTARAKNAATVPGAPTVTKVVAGEASATVTWAAPASDGGSPITGYTVHASPAAATATATPPSLTATVTHLRNGTPYTFTVVATNAAGGGPASTPSSPVTPSHPGAQYIPLAAYRVCDTRAGNPSSLSGTDAQCNGSANAGTTLGPGAQVQVHVGGTAPSGQTTGGVPASGASAVLLNVISLDTTTAGALTAWAAGATRPAAPSLQWITGEVASNEITVPLGAGGQLSFYNASGNADLLIDVEGYTVASPSSTAGLYEQVVSYRVCDTRANNPSVLSGTNAQCNTGGALAAGASRSIQVTGTNPSGQVAGGVPKSGVSAVILNVTAAGGAAAGHLTLWAGGTTQPTWWNFAWAAKETVRKRLVVPLNPAGVGLVSIANGPGQVDVIVDVTGYYTDGSNTTATGSYFTPLPPTVICDTVAGNPLGLTGQAAQCNGSSNAGAPLKAKIPRTIQVAGVGGVQAEATPAPPTAAVLDVTLEHGTAVSQVTVYPAGAGLPAVQDLIWSAGQTVENLVIAPLGSGGGVTLLNTVGQVDAVVQVLGFESGSIFVPPSTVPLSPATVSTLSSETYSAATKQSTLTFSGAPAQITALVPGQVINSAPTTTAPHGLMQKVAAVTASGGNTVVTAVPATPSEVLTEGALGYAAGATNYAAGLSKGSSSHAKLAPGGSASNINGTFGCGAGGTAGFSSTVNDFSLTPNFSLNWSPFSYFSADASLRLDLSYSHSYSISGNVSCAESFDVVTPTVLGPDIVVAVGPVAFMLTPVGQVQFVLQAQGSTPSMATSNTTTAFFEQGGVHCDTDNGCNVSHSQGCDAPVPSGQSGCTKTTSEPAPANLAVSLGLNFQITLAIDYLVTGAPLVGPFLSMTPALQFTLQPAAPVVSVGFNLQVQIGIQLQVWIIQLKAAFTLVNDTWPIFHSVAQTTAPDLPPAIASSPYSTQLSADGGTSPYSWSLPSGSGAPAWLHLSPGGAISGTPPLSAAGSTIPFNVTATDNGGVSATAAYTLFIGPAVSLTTKALADGIVNQSYYQYLQASGGTQPYTYSATGLPSWLALDTGSGLLSGTPPAGTGGTTYSLGVTVTDSTQPANHDGPHTLKLYVEPFGVVGTALPTATATIPYSAALQAQNGVTPYTWALDASSAPLPSWLSLAADGTVSGTPPLSARGSSVTFKVHVTDSSNPPQTSQPATMTLPVSSWVETVLQHSGTLTAVSCPSATFCKAVGTDGSGLPFAATWNGTTWQFAGMPSPRAHATHGGIQSITLSSVSCRSTTFCMVAGYDNETTGCGDATWTHPVTEMWNGIRWTVAANPPGVDHMSDLCISGTDPTLSGVSCVSTTFCMAVGANSTGQATTYVEQWDGAQWFTVPSPNMILPGWSTNNNTLSGVSCVSRISCVAVGGDQPIYNYIAPTLEHWDGHTWSLVTSQLGGFAGGASVSCTGATSCLAVGYQWAAQETTPGWQQVPALNNGSQKVSCVNATQCTVSGYTLEVWDGATWTQVPTPSSFVPGDISCADGRHCYVVGTNDGPGGPAIESSG